MPHESVTRLESFNFVEKMAVDRCEVLKKRIDACWRPVLGETFTLMLPPGREVVRFKLDENGEPVWL